jgi:hypothetical protein
MHLTDETIQAILRLSAEGKTQPQIAAIVHQTPHVVRTVIRANRPADWQPRQRYVPTEAEIASAAAEIRASRPPPSPPRSLPVEVREYHLDKRDFVFKLVG